LRGLTCRRVDRKCDGHTDTPHTHRQINLYSVNALHSIGQTITISDLSPIPVNSAV